MRPTLSLSEALKLGGGALFAWKEDEGQTEGSGSSPIHPHHNPLESYLLFFFFEFTPWASVAGGLHVEEMNSVSFWVPDALLPCCLFTLFEGLVFTLP